MLPALIAAGSNLLGGIISGNKQEDMANKNIALQKQFAREGIRWKVEDAKAAGLHPLAALGAQTHSFAPVSIGGNDVGTGLAAAGQDISRGINATRSAGERVDAYSKTIQDLNIQRMGLENQLLGAQIAKINQAGNPPAMPSGSDRMLVEGQGNSPLVKVEPLEQTSTAPGQPNVEAGANPEIGYARTGGGWTPVRSKAFQDRSEEDLLAAIQWNIRNRLAPALGQYNPPQNIPMDKGDYWHYNPITGEYQIWKPSDRRGRYGFPKWKG